MMDRPPPPLLPWQPTGRYRLAPNGEFVMLMLQEIRERTGEKRWRPATPGDAMALVGVEISTGMVAIGGRE